MEITWSHGDVQLQDMSMHFVRTGGNKPALVLAHGFSDNGMCWIAAAQALAADYDVILPDARGHGLSSPVTAGKGVNRSADLAEFIVAMGLEKPIVGGHSMGGITASALGAQHPELARALILEDPAWIERRQERPSFASEDNPWLKELRGYASLSLEEVMQKCRQASPQWPEVELRPWAESKKLLDLNVFKERDNLMDQDYWEFVRQISSPTLLITGEVEKGGIISAETARKASEINPLIREAHILGAGHNVRRENFPAYIAAVKDFLASL